MSQGAPPAPTLRSILGGISLFILLCLAVIWLPGLTKWAGAIFTFVPGQLGLIDVISRDEVMPVDMNTSPTTLAFDKPGEYLLYTGNYDLLAINDAVVAAKAKPWFRLLTDANQEIAITLVERGMVIYDTPLAKGRPVAHFEIIAPGTYTMVHPTRLDYAYIVPDYIFGHEGRIVTLMILQGLMLAFAFWYWRRARGAKRKPPTFIRKTPGSPESPEGRSRSRDGEHFQL